MCAADEPSCRRPTPYPAPPDLDHLPEAEAHPVYRATFLALYPPAQAAALEAAAQGAFYRALEALPGAVGTTEGELRAAARELEVTASYLAAVARQRFLSGFDERDTRLSQWAEALAVETDALARRIYAEVGGIGEVDEVDEAGGESEDGGGGAGPGAAGAEPAPPPPPKWPPSS